MTHPTPAQRDLWPRALRIGGHQIDAWANANRQAQGDLPILLRRLVLASGGVAAIDFPGGDAIFTPGWDGLLDSRTVTPWVPDGRSVWEVSCNGDSAGKATADYDKRTQATPPTERQATTIVIVTARRWSGKDKWREARLGAWRALRVYDANDLEQWLEQTPAVALWFAEQIGLAGPGMRTLDAAWMDWAGQAGWRLTPAALFAGREAQRDVLITAVAEALADGDGAPIGLRADSSGEAAAFAAAALAPHHHAAALVVTGPDGWRYVEQNPDIRIAVTASPELAAGAPQRPGLVMVVPFATGDMDRAGRGGEPEKEPIRLERPRIETFADALREMGVEDADARRLAVGTGRSWSVFRRRTSANPALRRPAWLDSPHTPALSTICLLGSWTSGKEADRDLVARLANRPFEDVERDLRKLARLDDAPVIQIGPVWKAKAPMELLDLFGDRITRAELDRFFDIARALRTAADPALDLPEKDRWAAAVYGKERPQSGLLHDAVCDTLIKLAVRGPTTSLTALAIEARVEAFVRDLLHGADAVRWLSLASDLPALAEAAPDAFLQAIEHSLSAPEAPVTRLLTETSEAAAMGRCWHAGLLWALEGLAWAPQRLGRVCAILARLAHTEIKGNWGNTPLNSLVDILRPWYPQTGAPLERRIRVLDTVIRYEPEVAFKLLDRLTCTEPDMATGIYRPTWRDEDMGAGRGTTADEARGMWAAAADRMISLAQGDAVRVAKLLDKASDLDDQRFAAVISLADRFAGPEQSDTDRDLLRGALRTALHWLRNGDQQEADRINDLDHLLSRLEPHDIVMRHRWLFRDRWIDLPDKVELSETQDRLGCLRADAVADVLDEEGLAGVRRLAGLAGDTVLVGEALGRTARHREALAAWFVAEAGDLGATDHMRGVITGVLLQIERVAAQGLLSNAVDLAQAVGWEPDRLARLLICAKAERATWGLAARLGQEVEQSYWRQVPSIWSRENTEDYRHALQRLMDAGRPRTVLRHVRLEREEADADLLFRCLEGILRGEEPDELLDGWDIQEAITTLEGAEGVNRISLARLEFGLFPALGFDGAHTATALFEAVTTEPESFTQLITMVYKPRNGSADPVPEEQRPAVETAGAVLRQCRRIPGTQSDGVVDPGALFAFVDRTRTLCRDADRLEVCDSTLGQILAHAPADADGSWPCVPVRDLLDRPELGKMRHGFAIGVFNKRGIFSRGADEGGAQERALAEQYRGHARAIQDTHLTLAASLEEIAKSYDEDARRADESARLRREGH